MNIEYRISFVIINYLLDLHKTIFTYDVYVIQVEINYLLIRLWLCCITKYYFNVHSLKKSLKSIWFIEYIITMSIKWIGCILQKDLIIIIIIIIIIIKNKRVNKINKEYLV